MRTPPRPQYCNRPLKLCPVTHKAEGEELELCQRQYDRVWGNGFVDYLRGTVAVRDETDRYLVITPGYVCLALSRDRDRLSEEKREEYGDCYQSMWHLATYGHGARVGAGLAFLVLIKPDAMKGGNA